MMCELVAGWLHAVDKLIAQRRGGRRLRVKLLSGLKGHIVGPNRV